MKNVWIALMVAFLALCRSSIPDGYIMQVTPDCGSNETSAQVHVLTDLNAYVKAVCHGQTVVTFNTSDDVNFYLSVGYSGNTRPCMFNQRENSEVYAVRIIISYGEIGNEVHNDEEIFTVTCTFDPKGNKSSGQQTISGRVIAPREIQKNVGEETESKLELLVTDINGYILANDSIDLGRKVLIIANSDGTSDEQGIRITACDAISGAGKSYQIIRAGCGDGYVFNKNEGFVTTNLTAMSPYFNMFYLFGNREVTFRCNFTMCEDNCDGSSCAAQRRRRAIVPLDMIEKGNLPLPPVKEKINKRSSEETERYEVIQFNLTNVAGESLTNIKLHHLRYYALHANIADQFNVGGFKIINCSAISTKRKPVRNVTIVTNGCGLAPLFNSSWGFMTTGMEASSSYFHGFTVGGDRSVRFECHVLLCDEECDGSSCSPTRRRRDTQQVKRTRFSRSVTSSKQDVNILHKRHLRLRGTDVIMGALTPSVKRLNPSLLTLY